jgi:hypothetical protein
MGSQAVQPEVRRIHHIQQRLDILQRKDYYLSLPIQDSNLKRVRKVQHAEWDRVVANWVLQMEGLNIHVTGYMIKEQARVYAETLGLDIQIPSNGWLQPFNQRHGFSGRRIHGKNGDASMENIEEKLAHVKKRIAAYEKKDILNFDETALRPSLTSDATIARHQIEGKNTY